MKWQRNPRTRLSFFTSYSDDILDAVEKAVPSIVVPTT